MVPWLVMMIVKTVLKVGPLPIAAGLWHYSPDTVVEVGVLVAFSAAVAGVVLAVAMRLHALHGATRIRRAQQLGIYRDPDPVDEQERLLRRYPELTG
jgi:hypothetical protein